MKKLLVVLVLALFVIPLAAHAETPALSKTATAKSSGLSADQEKQVKGLVEANMKKLQPIVEEMQKAAMSLEQEFYKENPNKSTLNSLNDKLSKAQKKMGELRIDYLLKLRSIVGAENFIQLIEAEKAQQEAAREKMSNQK